MMPEPTTYSGSCHCGRVRYDATVDLTQVMECNCSHCRRKGFLLTFISPDQFTLHSGEQDLTAYQFNKKIIQHLFCRLRRAAFRPRQDAGRLARHRDQHTLPGRRRSAGAEAHAVRWPQHVKCAG
jgi:hypothetical protein